jgi:predicted metal-dependent phosphoesterase TrpH
MAKQIKVEFHCHTIYSSDSVVKIEELMAACKKKGITKVVITDHNTIRGALEAKQRFPEQVIVGEEVRTCDGGEFLCAFISKEVPKELPWKTALKMLKDQGAFIAAAHPFDHARHGWQENQLLEMQAELDAMEVFNSRTINSAFNNKAARFALQHGIHSLVGSDAHSLIELGRATAVMPDFETATELRESLSQAVFQVKRSSALIHFTSVYARFYKQFFMRN